MVHKCIFHMSIVTVKKHLLTLLGRRITVAVGGLVLDSAAFKLSPGETRSTDAF